MKRKPRDLSKGTIENHFGLKVDMPEIKDRHLAAGDIAGMIPVRLDYKTFIFVNPTKDAKQVIQNYENRNKVQHSQTITRSEKD